MRAGLIDEYVIVTIRSGGRRHAVLHGPGQLGEPEPGGNATPSRCLPSERNVQRDSVTRAAVGGLLGRDALLLVRRDVAQSPNDRAEAIAIGWRLARMRATRRRTASKLPRMAA